MPSFISRAHASALIPEDVVDEIIKSATYESVMLQMTRAIRRMQSNELRLPVMTNLPDAYWVGEKGSGGGRTEIKPTTNARWNNKFIRAEELAVIVPIPEQVLEDTDYDVWGEIQPKISEAMGALIDRAWLFGENRPPDWPQGVVPMALAAGNAVDFGTHVDLYDDLLGEGGTIQQMEEVGYDPTGHIGKRRMKAKLRGLRDENNQPIFNTNTVQQRTQYMLDGVPMSFPKNGAIRATDIAELVSIDGNEFVHSFRTDMRFKISEDATLTTPDESGGYISLFEQDMVALRVTWRLGWEVANPPSRLSPDTDAQAQGDPYVGNPDRYPATVLTEAGYTS